MNHGNGRTNLEMMKKAICKIQIALYTKIIK